MVCKVPDVDPRVIITWSLNGEPLFEFQSSHVIQANGLTTSTSHVVLDPTFNWHGKALACLARSEYGDSTIDLTVNVDVKGTIGPTYA